MRIAVVNDVHVGRPLMHSHRARASSDRIEERLETLLDRVIKRHAPDLIINLGDLIRSQDIDEDTIVYRRLIAIFNRMKCPVIHMVGNHELKCMSMSILENLWTEIKGDQKSYGSRIIGEYQVIWLGLVLDPNDSRVCLLPSEQVNWLSEKLQMTHLPTLVFSHCPIDDHDTSGNFFYEAFDNRSKKALFLSNQNEVREVIASCQYVKAVFQAHLHYLNITRLGPIPYITCPAMGDNICGPEIDINIPEIYTLINIDPIKLSVKAFSGDYCFGGYEEAF